MRTRIWNNMSNIKFKAIYTCECSQLADRTGRAYSFFLSFASASSVAAWAIWQQLPSLWGGIIAVSQVLHIAKPYLPFMKYDKEFLEMCFNFEYLYLDYEQLWVAYDADRLTNEEAEKKFYILRDKEIKIEQTHKQIHCPRIKHLIAKAEEETKNALAINFT